MTLKKQIIFFSYSLKVQVENMKVRKRHVKNLEIVKMKLVWSEFEKLYLKVQEIETDLKKAKE